MQPRSINARDILKPAVQAAFATQSEALGLKPLDVEGRALKLDGLFMRVAQEFEIASLDGDSTPIETFLQERAPVIGHYSRSNFVTYWVNGQGEYYAGVVTPDEMEEAGYQAAPHGYADDISRGWPLPAYFDMGPEIIDPKTRREWDSILLQSKNEDGDIDWYENVCPCPAA